MATSENRKQPNKAASGKNVPEKGMEAVIHILYNVAIEMPAKKKNYSHVDSRCKEGSLRVSE